MDNSEELTDVVGAVHRSEMKHLLPCGQIYSLIFHLTRIAAAGGIHSPGVRPHLLG